MSEETISLISCLLAEHAIAASVATMEARLRFASHSADPEAAKICVDAMAEEMSALQAQNEFLAYVGREVT